LNSALSPAAVFQPPTNLFAS